MKHQTPTPIYGWRWNYFLLAWVFGNIYLSVLFWCSLHESICLLSKVSLQNGTISYHLSYIYIYIYVNIFHIYIYIYMKPDDSFLLKSPLGSWKPCSISIRFSGESNQALRSWLGFSLFFLCYKHLLVRQNGPPPHPPGFKISLITDGPVYIMRKKS
jgi:hypothetical protein